MSASTEEIVEKVNNILRKHLFLQGNTEIDRETELDLLGLDSLNTINILLDIEETFGIAVPDELLVPETFRTPSSLCTMICTLLHK